MDLFLATRAYERWVGAQGPTRRADFDYKHRRMALSPFLFLRGSYYRWAELFPLTCPEAAAAPRLLAIGDLHIENLGTWRDAAGRLVWGVNDFDEADRLPYTNDLVRLAASVKLGVRANLQIAFRKACAAILDGYAAALAHGGEPIVLEEKHPVLRKQALQRLRDVGKYWKAMLDLPPARGRTPAEAVSALARVLPEASPPLDLRWRRAGTGSLGRARVVALKEWRGGLVAREAKAAAGPASAWLAEPADIAPPIHYGQIVERAVRSPDPQLRQEPGWVVRRLSHDCSRVELSSVPSRTDQDEWLYAMGWETANVHLGSGSATRLLSDLRDRPATWLRTAARAMVAATRREFAAWGAQYRR